MGRFDGRTAIVTGTASGIGRATAQRLAADGAAVACIDVRADEVDVTAAAIRDTGGQAIGVACDVRSPESTRAAVSHVETELGPADILANVAGVLRFAHAHLMPEADWDLLLDVNLKGPFLMTQAVLPAMIQRGSGAIVNVASSAGMFGQAYNAAYCASKGGVVLMTKSLAWEYVRRGIRVNAIAPGGVATPMSSVIDWPDDIDFSLIRKTMAPDNHMLDPSEPAGLIAFLASDEAAGITGVVVPIDHGVTC
jgi:NAD(P)-dependent dehydrogenase (short-subunit alcohol dehydrogenase family)